MKMSLNKSNNLLEHSQHYLLWRKEQFEKSIFAYYIMKLP